jgi:2-polyprenyl-3-methyl-5-hydroxy-6-metoxy-1,4-benzoquinol methylase
MSGELSIARDWFSALSHSHRAHTEKPMQIETGIRSVLGHPLVYAAFRGLVGAPACYKELSDTYLRINPGDTVLDFGCGPGSASSFPDGCYVIGYDVSSDYIAHAARVLGSDQRLFTTDLDFVRTHGPYDVALALGVLHHLDDSEGRRAVDFMTENLKPGGRLITFDNVFVDDQSPIARWLISMDRGQNVRDVTGYRALFEGRNHDVTHDVRHDLLRIPYTHIIMQMTKRK